MGTAAEDHSSVCEANGQTHRSASGVHATADDVGSEPLQLFRHYRHEIVRLAYTVTGRNDNLEDIVRQVFLRIHHHVGRDRGEVDFVRWLRRVTVDVALHARAASSVAQTLPSPHAAESLLPSDERASRFERVRAFRRLVNRLPEKRRVAFLLHDVYGLSSAEVAGILDTSILAVRARLLHARRELTGMLQQEPGLVAFAKALEEKERRGAGELLSNEVIAG
jgi:RNA polymerase sigma-70 factor, ECF subfamily